MNPLGAPEDVREENTPVVNPAPAVMSQKEKVIFSKGKKEKVVTDSLLSGDHLADALAEDVADAFEAQALAEKMKQKKSKQLKHKDPAKTRAARAGLCFPVARIHSKLKALVPAHCRVGGTAAVFMAAVIEYLVAELCELAGLRAKKIPRARGAAEDAPANLVKKRRVRISPRMLQFAIKDDPEFDELLKKATLSGGGVVPFTEERIKTQFAGRQFAAPTPAVQDEDGEA